MFSEPKVLYVVDECSCLLADTETSSEPVAHAALLAMKMVEAALEKEEEFLATLRQSPTQSVLATPIPELLLGINPRSRKADHLVNIARFVSVCLSLCLSLYLSVCLSLAVISSPSTILLLSSLQQNSTNRPLVPSLYDGGTHQLTPLASIDSPHA